MDFQPILVLYFDIEPYIDVLFLLFLKFWNLSFGRLLFSFLVLLIMSWRSSNALHLNCLVFCFLDFDLKFKIHSHQSHFSKSLNYLVSVSPSSAHLAFYIIFSCIFSLHFWEQSLSLSWAASDSRWIVSSKNDLSRFPLSFWSSENYGIVIHCTMGFRE